MTGRETLLALADRCEQATGPDRRIDYRIGLIVGVHNVSETMLPHIMAGSRVDNRVPRYTASLDAAMTLVPVWLTPNIVGHEHTVTLLNGIGNMKSLIKCKLRIWMPKLEMTEQA